MRKIVKTDYDLYISKNSIDLFNYFDVDNIHGLQRSDCVRHKDTRDNCFIAGLCNSCLVDSDRYFVFINLRKSYDPVQFCTLVMHEFTHLAFRLYDYNLDTEEKIITFAENETNNFLKNKFYE